MSQKIATFAKRLREALDERGMTQTALAQMSGISKSSISRYLSGAWEGKQDAVYALSKALHVNEAWLMGYDVPMDRDAKHRGEMGYGILQHENQLVLNIQNIEDAIHKMIADEAKIEITEEAVTILSSLTNSELQEVVNYARYLREHRNK